MLHPHVRRQISLLGKILPAFGALELLAAFVAPQKVALRLQVVQKCVGSARANVALGAAQAQRVVAPVHLDHVVEKPPEAGKALRVADLADEVCEKN